MLYQAMLTLFDLIIEFHQNKKVRIKVRSIMDVNGFLPAVPVVHFELVLLHDLGEERFQVAVVWFLFELQFPGVF